MSSRAIPSEAIHNVDEEDDEFDWEAAVREIDVACQGSLATNPRAEEDFANTPVLGNEAMGISRRGKKRSSGNRQSTLDEFVNAAGRRQVIESGSFGNRRAVDIVQNNVEVGDDDAACYCEIDLEAAKKWIYPGLLQDS